MSDHPLAALLTRRAALALGALLPLGAQSKPEQTKGESTGHPVVRFEIGCQDRSRTEKFFGELFGWNIARAGAASNIDTGGAGIPGHIVSLGHEPQHYILFYVEVEDVQAYLDKAHALGGKTIVPPVKIPTGTFAWFSDLDGNIVGLLKKS